MGLTTEIHIPVFTSQGWMVQKNELAKVLELDGKCGGNSTTVTVTFYIV